MSSKNGKKFMDVVTYTGNGGTQSITGLDFSPDLVWTKNRDELASHALYDSVRGPGELLRSNETSQEANVPDRFTSFDSNGFTIGSTSVENNASGDNYVSWCWDAGDTTVTNNDGTIESQVRANPEAGFSIVSYTGSGSAGTVGHGLGKAPGLVIVKNRNSGSSWPVWHKAFGTGNTFMFLDSNAAFSASDSYWNNDVPTDTTISVGVANNTASRDHIAYCWSEVPGYSKIGKYTGNGTNSNFVYTGFKPRYIMTKPFTAGGDWLIWDTQRDQTNPNDATLSANTNEVDADGSGYDINVVSNGFHLAEFGSSSNASGQAYIWMAFADIPTFTPQETTLTFEGSKDLETIDAGSLVYQGSVAATVKSKNAATNQLTFAGSHNFQEDSPVNSDVNGSGVISSIDIATNRMTLTDVKGSFAPNKGRSVIGSVRRLPKYQSETSGLIGAVDAGVEYEVEQSIAFNGYNSYLGWTPATNANLRTFTLSFWAKAVGPNVNNDRVLHVGGASSSQFSILMPNGGNGIQLTSAVSFSTKSIVDPNAWMHVVLAIDSTQAVQTERMKLYVDGEQLQSSDFNSITYPNQNQTFYWGAAQQEHSIGRYGSTINEYWDGILADFQYVDGVAHDANAFGYFDAYGFWNPKDYTDPKVLNTITTATASQLTLASNTNYSELAVGKTIQQDSGYTAETSAITGVGGGGSYASTWFTDGTAVNDPGDANNTWDKAFNGTQTGITDGTYGNPGVEYTFDQSMTGTWVFDVYLGSGVNTGTVDLFRLDDYVVNGDDPGWVTFGTSQYGRLNWTGTVNKITLPNGAMYLNKVTFNNAFLIVGNAPAGTPPTVLTLTDDTDLANFRIGDLVDTGARYVKTADTFTSLNPQPISSITGWSSGTGPAPIGPGEVYWDLGSEHPWSAVKNYQGIYVSSDGTNWTLISSNIGTGGNYEGTSRYIYMAGVQPDWSLSSAEATPAVTAIGPGDTLTVSGGTWSNGDTVSAALAAGVGTVTAFDSTANTIDYTLVGGRFIGGASKVANVLANTYGTQGSHLPFTPGDLGADAFGSNDWTPNNFTDASVVDSPTNYGTDTGVGNEVRSNYATWNALSSTGGTNALSEGALKVLNTTTTYDNYMTTLAIESGTGSWYWECEITNTAGNMLIGIAKVGANLTGNNYVGGVADTWAYGDSGYRWSEGSYVAGAAGYNTVGTILGILFNSDTGVIEFYNGGVLDTSIAIVGYESGTYLPAIHSRNNSGAVFNFGQKEFAHAAPAGAKILNINNF